jgi:hypothetical protein
LYPPKALFLRSSRERLKGDLLAVVQENLPKHNPTSEFTEKVVFETEKLNSGSLVIKVEVERRHPEDGERDTKTADTFESRGLAAPNSPQETESESSKGEEQQAMKVFAVFDVYVDGQEVDGELIKPEVAKLSTISGVNSAELLERVAGEVPRYCIELDIEDTNAEETGEKLLVMLNHYSSYLTNMTWGAYEKI